MDKQTIALFDFDIIAYRAAAAAEKRSVKITYKSSGNSGEFKNRTEFKKFLKSKDIPYDESKFLIEDVQRPEPVENACQIVKMQVYNIKRQIKADYTEGFVGTGDDNFRLQLDLPKLYKGNREDMLRPLLLDDAKKYVLNKFPGEKVAGIESDDMLVIRSHEFLAAGHKPVVITLDKDQWGCVGTSYYDWTKEDAKVIDVPAFGYVEHIKEKNKTVGLGLNFYCFQMLNGDSADNYFPSDLHGKRFGEISAVNLLRDCTTVGQLFEVVEKQYKEWFPSPITYKTQTGSIVTKDYKDILELYHQSVYMKRKRNDTTTFDNLREEFT